MNTPTAIQLHMRDLLVRNSAIVAVFVGLDPDALSITERVVADILLADGQIRIVEDEDGNREIIRGDIMKKVYG